MKPKFVTYLANTEPDKLMSQNLHIGNNIKRFRDRLGLTQEQLAKYLNISRGEVVYYENGIRNIPSGVISKAAQLFGLDEYDLYESNPELIDTNLAFAFRASLNTEDLEPISEFQKIVRNYIQLNKVLNNERNAAGKEG
jgi:transcriptional regulator with XRE-family HTH domain